MAKKNGHKQEQALVIGQPLSVFQRDPDIEHAETAEIGVKQVLAYGITALLQDRACADLVGLLPEPTENEQPWEYADRARAHLLNAWSGDEQQKIRAAIIDLGMDRADTSRHLLAAGRRILAWRVYASDTLGGIWLDSPSGAESFDEWLANVSRNASKAERSRIRTACKALAWLLDNGHRESLPQNPEEVFYPGNWRKWSTALAAVWRRKLALDNEEGIEERAKQDIEALLAYADSEETTTADMRRFVKEHDSPPPPPIIVSEKQKDPDTGLYTGTILYTEAQKSVLMRDRRFEWRLEGEEYNIPVQIVQYRTMAAYTCSRCGCVQHRPMDYCPDCGDGRRLVSWETHSVREWLGNRWSEWQELDEEPNPNGHLLHEVKDPDLGLIYRQYLQTA